MMISLGGWRAGASCKGCSGQRCEPLSKVIQLMTCAAHSSGLAAASFGPALRGWPSEFQARDLLWTGLPAWFDQECGKRGREADSAREITPDRRVQPRDSTNGTARATRRALINSPVCGAHCCTTGTSSWDGGAVAAARRSTRPVMWPRGSQWQSPRWGWARQRCPARLMNASFPVRAFHSFLKVHPPRPPFRRQPPPREG